MVSFRASDRYLGGHGFESHGGLNSDIFLFSHAREKMNIRSLKIFVLHIQDISDIKNEMNFYFDKLIRCVF